MTRSRTILSICRPAIPARKALFLARRYPKKKPAKSKTGYELIWTGYEMNSGFIEELGGSGMKKIQAEIKNRLEEKRGQNKSPPPSSMANN
jgi:hypothetical protein